MEHKNKFETLLKNVFEEGASDLHLGEGQIPHIRINSMLLPLVSEKPSTKQEIEAFMNMMMTDEDKKKLMDHKEADFSYMHESGSRFRVNGFYHQSMMAFALRLIPKHIKSLSELNLPNILETFIHKPQGFFLVVGPIGEGKSTTLASMIEMINQDRTEHILTIEDPIEYIYEPKKSIINQREIGKDTESFYHALTSMLREDIDVCLLGEMRDLDTIGTAVTAAETGHLVFSTLHTNNAPQTINRIIDSFPPNQQDQIRNQLSTSLTGIFSQRLIPRISGGLIPAYELLINNSAISNLIREKRIHEINTVIETSLEQGMISMDRTLAELVRAGEISVQNAYLHTENAKVLEKLL